VKALYNVRGQPSRDFSPSLLSVAFPSSREVSGPRRAGINGGVSARALCWSSPFVPYLSPLRPFARIARVETRFEIRRRRPGRRDPPTGFALLFALRNDRRRVPGTQSRGRLTMAKRPSFIRSFRVSLLYATRTFTSVNREPRAAWPHYAPRCPRGCDGWRCNPVDDSGRFVIAGSLRASISPCALRIYRSRRSRASTIRFFAFPPSGISRSIGGIAGSWIVRSSEIEPRFVDPPSPSSVTIPVPFGAPAYNLSLLPADIPDHHRADRRSARGGDLLRLSRDIRDDNDALHTSPKLRGAPNRQIVGLRRPFKRAR